MGAKRTIPATENGPGGTGRPGYHFMSLVAVSGTNVYTSPTFNANYLDNLGLQIAFGGAPTGTLTVNCSIDNVTFTPLTFNPALAQPAGTPLTYLIDINQLPFPYLQVQYTNASGSGTLDVFLSAKDLN